MTFKQLSIIIPAYNEDATIENIVAKVREVVLPKGINKQIIIVDDGSTDATGIKALDLVADDLVLIRQDNQGKTSAILAGIRQASGDILLIQDADLEYDPQAYPQLITPILDGKTQVVYGSRFLGVIKGMELINRAANLVSNWSFRLLYKTPITDINTCYKVFTRRAFEGIEITSHGFAFETELTIKLLAKGLEIIEVPIEYHARSKVQGKKIRWLTALHMFWPIIQYRFFKTYAVKK